MQQAAPGACTPLARLAGLLGRLGPTGRAIRKADAARDRRDWPAAIAAYSAILRRDARRAAVWVQLGHARKESGDRAGAEAAYREALARNPRSPDTLLHLAHVVARGGGEAEAARMLARALCLGPPHPALVQEARRVLGRRLGALGTAASAALAARIARNAEAGAAAQGRAAELVCRHLIELDPDDTGAARQLAGLLADRGALAEAQEVLAGLLWRNPADQVSREALVAVKARRNALARAEIAAARGIPPEALPSRLRFVAFGTTGVCNASCIHCPTGKPETAHVPRITMPMPLFERIARQLAELHLSLTSQVSLGLFGDGLVDPLVVERVRLLRRLLPDALISVNTNGAAYNPARHGALFGQVSEISLHCESLREETYNTLMAPLRLKNVRPKIEALLRDFPGKVHVSVPVSRLNRDELPEIKAFFEARNVLAVGFDALSSRCTQDRTVFDSLALRPVPIRCNTDVDEDLIVDCDGRVTICCQDFRREEPVGDLARQSLVELLLSPERAEVREQFASNRHAERATCSRCYADIAGSWA